MLREFVKAAAVSELAEGEMKALELEGEDILLTRLGGEYFAVNNICTHFYTWLSEGELFPETCEVLCPLHDSRFSLRTGDPTGPPATVPIATYSVHIEGDDILIGPRE